MGWSVRRAPKRTASPTGQLQSEASASRQSKAKSPTAATASVGGLDVGHKGLGEVGKIAPAEERERQLAQPLGEADALPAALFVDDAVLVIVGKILGYEKRDREDGDRQRVGRKVGQRRVFGKVGYKRAPQRIDDAHAAEDGKV